MREDKFGIIKDEDYQFNSIEEAGNYTKDLKDKLKRKASMEEFSISSAMPEDRMKFLEYAISLMTKKNLPLLDNRLLVRARAVLWLVAKGYTYQAIAGYLKKNGFPNTKPQEIRDVELKGVKWASQAIERVKNTQVPIVGGV